MLDDNIIAKERDQFYTQEIVANSCLKRLYHYLGKNRLKNTIWLEPSAGTGVFLKLLAKQKYTYLAYDIEPKYNTIIEKDFLTITEQDIHQQLPQYNQHNLITIGNPPFGKNSSLAVRFFNHAAQYSEVVAMILPATFDKQSVKKRLHKNMHLVESIRLENDLFILNNNLVPVPTVFQIWEKKKEVRIDTVGKLISEHFSFVKKEEADFSLQRVGVAAGKVKREFEHLAQASHYFIKADEKIYNILNKIDWSVVKYNTAGNPSISKKELIDLLEKELNK